MPGLRVLSSRLTSTLNVRRLMRPVFFFFECFPAFLITFCSLCSSVQTKEEELQQAGDRDPERVLLLPSQQPLSQRGGQRGAGQKMQYHGGAGKKDYRQSLAVLSDFRYYFAVIMASFSVFRVKQHQRHIFNISLKGFYLRGVSVANVRLDSL